MTEFIQHPVVQALAWALVHFVWQGAAIGLLSYAAFRVARSSASARYAIGVGALVAMLAAPAATFLILANRSASAQSSVAGTTTDLMMAIPVGPGMTLDVNASAPAPRLRVEANWLAVAVMAWLAGVTFFSLRLIGGWIVARRYAQRAVQPASDQIQALARQLADRLAVRRAVAILQSAAVAVPVMVGWLKPTIVLPMAALSGLSPTQVEALLAHELAHVRRHDYLVNLLQSIAEALLFYHPAVWWLSRRVRAERELCCDDLAVGVCDRLVYATALTDLAAMASPRVALAATDGDLLSRIRRILGEDETAPAVRAGVMPLLAFVLVAGVVVPVALASASGAPIASAVRSAIGDPVDAVTPQTTPKITPTPLPQTTPTAKPATTPAATPSPTPSAQDNLRKTLEDIRVQVDEARRKAEFDRQAAIEQGRKAMEQAQVARQAELDAARKAYEDAKKKFEVGLVSETQLREAKDALAKAEARGDVAATVAARLQQAQAEVRRSQLLIERGLLAPTDALASAATLKALEQRMADMKIDQKAIEQAVQSAQALREKSVTDFRQLSELLAARRAISGVGQLDQQAIADAMAAATARVAANPFDMFQHLDPSAPAQAGDVLRITISGEPDLPASYRVAEDGTIRVPFVGAIKVSGLTAAQVRDAVGKQLSSKKLGSVDQVTVTVGTAGDDQAKVTPKFEVRSSSSVSLHLPLADGVDRRQQHHDVQREVVANQHEHQELDRHDQRDAGGHAQPRGQQEADRAHDDVAEGIQDAVADVPQGDGHRPIAIDDERGVLEDLPSGFEHHRDEEPRAERQPARDEPDQAIEQEAVQDVGGRVGVQHALRLTAAPDVGFQPAEPPVRSEGQPAHPQFDRGRGHHYGEDRERQPAGPHHRGIRTGAIAHRLAMTA